MTIENNNYLSVPYGRTVHGEEEIAAVVEVLKTSTQMGPHVRQIENQVAKLFAKKYGIMVNSGSSANFLATRLLGLEPGCEVLTPALTFSTTVSPLVQNHLIPAFIDVEEGTYNIDIHKMEELISPKTKAIMVPNLIGNMPDWDHIQALAKKYQLLVIEDSADTLGGTLRGISTGSRSDISTTSFYGSHVINCAGNGGMLCVNSDHHEVQARLLRSWGRSSSLFVESEKIENRFNVEVDGIPYDAKFVFEALGYNFEPSEMGAAFGLVQLSKLENNISLREEFFNKQLNFFKQYEDWFILPRQMPQSRTGWLAFPLTIRSDAPFQRRELQIFMEKKGVQTRTVFTGNILRQPGFKNVPCKKLDSYPEADKVMRGGMLLACHHGLTNEQLAHIHSVFTDFVRQVK